MNGLLRVLIVEDSPDDAELLAHHLRRGGFQPEWRRVESAAAMREALQGQTWDLILCDYMLPRFSGPKALTIFKESGQDIPFIIVSGVVEMREAVSVMKAGAHDFMEKGEMSRLIPAIQRELREAQNRLLKKAAEQALKEANANLEQQVRERTRELRNTVVRLEQARAAAESANRAKSAFIANMSHELHTPLNAILGFSQLMARDAEIPPRARDNLRTIERNGKHLLDMINGLLALSKIESGKMKLNSEAFDLQILLQELSAMFKLEVQAKRLDFKLEAAENLVRYVRTDLEKLRQIMINLLGNAIKFTDQGWVVLRAYSELAPGPAGHAKLVLEVEDSGAGIPAEMQTVVFNPFVQTDTTELPLAGCGLGLPVCRSFIDLMGGELTLQSIPGKGSLFRVAVPLTMEESAEVSAARTLLPQAESMAAASPPPLAELRMQDLAELPQDLLQTLLEAALQCDMKKIAAAETRIRAQAPDVADAIHTLTGQYHYQKLIELCEQALEF